jgi:tetratricopeptide (TPR) repeat protein
MIRIPYLLLTVLSIALFTSCTDNVNNNFPETDKKALAEKYPDSLSLQEDLVQSLRETGRYDEAIAKADAVLRRDSLNAYWWNMKAELSAENDDTTNAIMAWEKAVDIQPLPTYLHALGYLYANTKNEKAIMVADALLLADKAKSEREAGLIKGIYYANTGNNKAALSVFDQVLAIDYTYMFAYREKAIVLYNMGDYTTAIQLLQKATTLQNGFDEGYYWMGRCYEKLKNIPEAVAAYQQALFYNKDFIEAQDALARLGIK